MSKKNDVVTGFEVGQAFGTLLWSLAFFGLGVFYLGHACFSDFDPLRTIAGCALVCTAVVVGGKPK